jgi:hypothetical protein
MCVYDLTSRCVLISIRPLCMHVFCHGCLMQEHQSCLLCRADITVMPIRDNGFELRLFNVIVDSEISNPAVRNVDVTAYTWPGIVFSGDA